MATKIHDVNGVIPAVRKQLVFFRGNAPLQQAAKAWYESLDEETRRQVEGICLDIAETIRGKGKSPLGVTGALELLAALIAFDQGWLPGGKFRARRMQLKYDQRWRKHHKLEDDDGREA